MHTKSKLMTFRTIQDRIQICHQQFRLQHRFHQKFKFQNQNNKQKNTSTLPADTITITRTTDSGETVIKYTDINSLTTITGSYTFVQTDKNKTVTNVIHQLQHQNQLRHQLHNHQLRLIYHPLLKIQLLRKKLPLLPNHQLCRQFHQKY